MRVSPFKHMHFTAFGVLLEFQLSGCRFMNHRALFAHLYPLDSNMGLLIRISSFFYCFVFSLASSMYSLTIALSSLVISYEMLRFFMC